MRHQDADFVLVPSSSCRTTHENFPSQSYSGSCDISARGRSSVLAAALGRRTIHTTAETPMRVDVWR